MLSSRESNGLLNGRSNVNVIGDVTLNKEQMANKQGVSFYLCC